jgi:hypothetical protein
MHVLGYKDLTKKKQDDARTLPKGIYIEKNDEQNVIIAECNYNQSCHAS